jgi:hypothetical protein
LTAAAVFVILAHIKAIAYFDENKYIIGLEISQGSQRKLAENPELSGDPKNLNRLGPAKGGKPEKSAKCG